MFTSDSRLCALICEYNPFHYGHKYQLDELHSRGFTVVCLMSGELVQRGGIPVADKYDRARAAVSCGADIVLELPTPYCSLGARDFAKAGVTLANALGIKTLAFGCEDPDEVGAAADALRGAESEIQALLKEKRSLSYPRAREEYLKKQSIPDGIISKPNNILAVEYLLAMPEGMEMLSLRRSPEFESAGEIRMKSRDAMLASLPAASAEVFRQAGEVRGEKLATAMIADLRRKSADDLRGIYDITNDLAFALINASRASDTPDAVVAALRSRIYTDAKLRRTVVNSYFGITGEAAHSTPPYTALLAMKGKCSGIFGEIVKNSQIPVLTKTVSLSCALPKAAADALNSDLRIREVLSLCSDKPSTARSPYIGA